MSESRTRKLLCGIGNNSRSDDGLGWEFVNRIQATNRFEGDIIQCYQLQVEDADLISNYDEVIFVDATTDQFSDGYSYEGIQAAAKFSFTTHELNPEVVLHLCEKVYAKQPAVNILLISGYDFSLKMGLSKESQLALINAISFFESRFLTPLPEVLLNP